MGYYGNWGMMGGMGWFMVLTWLLLTIDLALLGIWLWQKINKK